MKYITNLIAAITALSILFLFTACGDIGDPRFNGWAKYKDTEDGYTLFVPPDWSVSGFNIPGTRSSRFYNEIMYTGDRSAFVYFAVIVVDEKDNTRPLEEVSRETIKKLTTGIWKNFNLKTRENSGDRLVFTLSGDPFYSSYRLRGKVVVLRHKNKTFYLMASGTNAAYKELEETYEKIFSGFQPEGD